MEEYRLPSPLVHYLRACKFTGKPTVHVDLQETIVKVVITWNLLVPPTKTSRKRRPNLRRQRFSDVHHRPSLHNSQLQHPLLRNRSRLRRLRCLSQHCSRQTDDRHRQPLRSQNQLCRPASPDLPMMS